MSIKNFIAIVRFQFIRGSSWISSAGIGFLVVDALQRRAPNLINKILFFLPPNIQFIFLFIICIIGVWFMGYCDAKLQLLHAEALYAFNASPGMTKIDERLDRIEKRLNEL